MRYHVVGKGPTDRHGYGQPSRFFTPEVTALLERTVATPAGSAADGVVSPLVHGGTAAVRDTLRRRWA
jgi:hypothetical protein